METLIEEIVDKLHHLPEPAVRQVLDLVECLTERGNLAANSAHGAPVTEEPLLSVAGILSGQPWSSQEIEADLYGE
ncbi:MAG: hypothetical protein HC772_15380 [Leptolyngbyaceae cyanobacterium CRU_2_3]|nr:hypothetical protein [Leptolyngbyaceae cyanobacterium CRU_2_3]